MCCLLFCEIGKRPAANAAGLFRYGRENNNEEGEEKGRFVPSHGGEEAKALQRRRGVLPLLQSV